MYSEPDFQCIPLPPLRQGHEPHAQLLALRLLQAGGVDNDFGMQLI